jgi:hypothetical protein
LEKKEKENQISLEKTIKAANSDSEQTDKVMSGRDRMGLRLIRLD